MLKKNWTGTGREVFVRQLYYAFSIHISLGSFIKQVKEIDMYKIELILNSDEYAALSMQAYLRKRLVGDHIIHILNEGVGSGWETPPVEWYESGIKPPDGRVVQIRGVRRDELPEEFRAYYDFIHPDESSDGSMIYAELIEPDDLPEDIQIYVKDIAPEEASRNPGRNEGKYDSIQNKTDSNKLNYQQEN